MEDVLLAQSRDTFTQLSAAEFFRLQDLYENVCELMKSSYLPASLKEKLILLNSMNALKKHGKLEFVSQTLDLLIKKIQDDGEVDFKNENQLI